MSEEKSAQEEMRIRVARIRSQTIQGSNRGHGRLFYGAALARGARFPAEVAISRWNKLHPKHPAALTEIRYELGSG